VSSWFNGSTAKGLGAVSRQQQLPLAPRGAPAPRTPTHSLPRPSTPGFKPSRPVPLTPETDDGR
jgi:hypothetical protein